MIWEDFGFFRYAGQLFRAVATYAMPMRVCVKSVQPGIEEKCLGKCAAFVDNFSNKEE